MSEGFDQGQKLTIHQDGSEHRLAVAGFSTSRTDHHLKHNRQLTAKSCPRIPSSLVYREMKPFGGFLVT
jgi:hypothetical protein